MEDNFNTRHEILILGYMQALFLEPKNENSLFLVPFTILNVYLLSGKHKKTNLLGQAKHTLPCGKMTLTHLIGPNDEWVDEPQD